MNSSDPKLPYSEHGEFNFCNLRTWEKTDDSSIKDYAVDQTEKHGGNVTQEAAKSTEQIIEEFHLVPCIFPRDALFTFMIVEESSLQMFKDMNSKGQLNRTSFKQNSDESVVQVYYYSSELATFNFANSDYISRHDITEYFVVLDNDYFYYVGNYMASTDYDLTMVN